MPFLGILVFSEYLEGEKRKYKWRIDWDVGGRKEKRKVNKLEFYWTLTERKSINAYSIYLLNFELRILNLSTKKHGKWANYHFIYT